MVAVAFQTKYLPASAVTIVRVKVARPKASVVALPMDFHVSRVLVVFSRKFTTTPDMDWLSCVFNTTLSPGFIVIVPLPMVDMPTVSLTFPVAVVEL